MHIFSVYSVHFLLSCNPSTLNSPFCETICNFMKISKTPEFSRQGHKVFMAVENHQRVRFIKLCSIWCCCAVQVTVFLYAEWTPTKVKWNYLELWIYEYKQSLEITGSLCVCFFFLNPLQQPVKIQPCINRITMMQYRKKDWLKLISGPGPGWGVFHQVQPLGMSERWCGEAGQKPGPMGELELDRAIASRCSI